MELQANYFKYQGQSQYFTRVTGERRGGLEGETSSSHPSVVLSFIHRYNIPIALWILEQYPQFGPIVYVTPTADMMVLLMQHS